MLEKIMHKGDLYFPNLSDKKLRSANNVDEYLIYATTDNNLPKVFVNSYTAELPVGTYRLYLADHSTIRDGYGFALYDLTSYLKNGGVFNSLLTHIKQAFRVSLLKRGALNA